MGDELIDHVRALLKGRSDNEKREVVEAIVEDMRTPLTYSFEELDAALKVARQQRDAATSEAERQRWGRRRFDLDFERRRRSPGRWLGGPPAPREFPEGLGPDEEYPRDLGGTQS
jgi:hypothetical protein